MDRKMDEALVSKRFRKFFTQPIARNKIFIDKVSVSHKMLTSDKSGLSRLER